MKTTNNKTGMIATAVVLVILLAACIAVDAALPSYHIAITVIKKATVYALVAVSMNLLNGFTGLFSLGQAGFMLLGAYSYAILTIPVAKRAGVYQYFDGGWIQFSLPEIFSGALGDTVGSVVGMLLALLVGGILAALVAYLIGLPVLRLKSDYLAIATLGFAEILRAFFQWDKRLSTFVPFLLAAVCISVILLLINSTYGRAFKAIRDDEVAAEAMGINLAHHKRLAFIISSFFAGIGGGMMAMYMGTIASLPFKSSLTYEILLIVVIGGIGSITGSVLASFLYIFLSEWLLRGLDAGTFLGITAPAVFKNGFRMAVFSVIIMVVVLFFRKGIMGDKELPDLFKKRAKKEKKEAAQS